MSMTRNTEAAAAAAAAADATETETKTLDLRDIDTGPTGTVASASAPAPAPAATSEAAAAPAAAPEAAVAPAAASEAAAAPEAAVAPAAASEAAASEAAAVADCSLMFGGQTLISEKSVQILIDMLRSEFIGPAEVVEEAKEENEAQEARELWKPAVLLWLINLGDRYVLQTQTPSDNQPREYFSSKIRGRHDRCINQLFTQLGKLGNLDASKGKAVVDTYVTKLFKDMNSIDEPLADKLRIKCKLLILSKVLNKILRDIVKAQPNSRESKSMTEEAGDLISLMKTNDMDAKTERLLSILNTSPLRRLFDYFGDTTPWEEFNFADLRVDETPTMEGSELVQRVIDSTLNPAFNGGGVLAFDIDSCLVNGMAPGSAEGRWPSGRLIGENELKEKRPLIREGIGGLSAGICDCLRLGLAEHPGIGGAASVRGGEGLILSGEGSIHFAINSTVTIAQKVPTNAGVMTDKNLTQGDRKELYKAIVPYNHRNLHKLVTQVGISTSLVSFPYLDKRREKDYGSTSWMSYVAPRNIDGHLIPAGVKFEQKQEEILEHKAGEEEVYPLDPFIAAYRTLGLDPVFPVEAAGDGEPVAPIARKPFFIQMQLIALFITQRLNRGATSAEGEQRTVIQTAKELLRPDLLVDLVALLNAIGPWQQALKQFMKDYYLNGSACFFLDEAGNVDSYSLASIEAILIKKEAKLAEDSKAEDSKAEDSKAEDSKAEDSKAEDSKAEDSKAADSKAADSKAADSKAADSKSEDNELEDSSYYFSGLSDISLSANTMDKFASIVTRHKLLLIARFCNEHHRDARLLRAESLSRAQERVAGQDGSTGSMVQRAVRKDPGSDEWMLKVFLDAPTETLARVNFSALCEYVKEKLPASLASEHFFDNDAMYLTQQEESLARLTGRYPHAGYDAIGGVQTHIITPASSSSFLTLRPNVSAETCQPGGVLATPGFVVIELNNYLLRCLESTHTEQPPLSEGLVSGSSPLLTDCK
jgi:hypothetical protein